MVLCVLRHSHMSLSEYQVRQYLGYAPFSGTFRHSKFQIPPTASDSWMMALPVINTRSLQYLRRCGGSGTQATSDLIWWWHLLIEASTMVLLKQVFGRIWNCPGDGVWFMHSLVRKCTRDMLLKQNKCQNFLVGMSWNISPEGVGLWHFLFNRS